MLKSNPIIICGAQCGGAFKQFVIRCLLQAYSVHIRQGLGFEVVLVDEVFSETGRHREYGIRVPGPKMPVTFSVPFSCTKKYLERPLTV